MSCDGSCSGTASSLAYGILLGSVGIVAIDSLRARALRLPSQSVLALVGFSLLVLSAVELRSRSGGPDADSGVGGRAAAATDSSASEAEHGVGVGEHYRVTASPYADGLYRVVGAGDPIALLRVTDADGRRRHTGELVRVSPHAIADEFEAADDPDAGFSPARNARSQLQGLYWSVRRFF